MTALSGSMVRRALRRVSGLGGPRRSLLLVVDRAEWILDDVSQHLRTNLPPSYRPRVVQHEWTDARDCTIHFLNRTWAWSDGVLEYSHRSNRLIGLWWHGRLDSPDPSMLAALERLRQLHPRFDRLQVTCSSARDTLLQVGVPPEKIVTLPEGVSLDRFHPALDDRDRGTVRAELGIPHDAFVVGCFQKDGEGWGDGSVPKLVKGPDVLVATLVGLHGRRPLHALLPGPARGYVTARLAAARIPTCAPGFMPAAAMPRLYHALDAYVSPSRDEGGPAGVLEAMASGVPVVSTRTGMAVDLIEHGISGFVADIDNPDMLAESLARLSDDGDARRAIGERGRRRVAPLDWPVLARRYATDLYAPVVAGRGSAERLS